MRLQNYLDENITKTLIKKVQKAQMQYEKMLDSGKGDPEAKMKNIQKQIEKLQKMGTQSVKGVFGRQ